MICSIPAIDNNAGVLILLLIIVDAVLLVLTFILYRQFSLMRKNIHILKRGAEGENVIEVVSRHIQKVEENTAIMYELSRKHDYILEVLAEALQRVAVVRFDAFEDMGGKLSYAVAILDDNGDGVIFTSIYGRNENRTYAKAVKGGVSSHALTAEEDEALKRAMRMKPAILRPQRPEIKRVFDIQAEHDFKDFASEKGEDGSWVM